MRGTDARLRLVWISRVLGAVILTLLCWRADALPIQVTRIVPAQPTYTAPQKISVAVFFNFTETTQKLLATLKSWAADAGGDITFEEVPLVSSADRGLARAFYVAQTLGISGPVSSSLFDLRKVVKSLVMMKAAKIFHSWGIGKIGFEAAWSSKRTEKLLLKAEALAARYEVRDGMNPVVIINGAWRLNVSQSVKPAQVIKVLDSKIAWLRNTDLQYD